MLREVEGLNTAETAESLGVSEDVVKTRLSRSRAALAICSENGQESWRPMPSASRSRVATGS
jgi:DNA-directed RNA polymerase specialized sigma24 family protein